MSEEIGFRLNVDEGNSQKSVKSFKQELKEAKQEAVNTAREFGKFSPQAVEAAKKLGDLKLEMSDLNKLSGSLTDVSKWHALTSVGGTIAGGFSAAQGAIGLATGESKKFQEAMLKVQSAMAISQGISQVADLGRTWGQTKAALSSFTIVQKVNSAATAAAALVQKTLTGAVETTSTGFKVLRGAIIATGIGALAVGIGYVVANFGKLKEMILNLIPGLSSVASFISKIVTAVTDFVGVTSEASRAADKLRGSITAQNDAADKNIQLMEASGATSKEVRKLKNQMYEDELNNLRGVLNLGQKLSEEESKRFKDLKFQQQLLRAQQAKQDKDDAEAAKKKADDELKAAQEKSKKIAAERLAALKKEAAEREKKDAEIFAQYEKDQQAAISALNEKHSYELSLLKAQGKEITGLREKQIDEEIELLNNAGGKFKDAIIKLEHEKEIARAQAETDIREEKAKKDKEQAEREADIQNQLKEDADAARVEGVNTDLLRLQEKYDAMREVVQGNEALLTEVTEAEAKERAEILKKYDDETLAAKLEFVDNIGGSLQQLSSLFGKSTNAAKAVAITGIITEQAAAIGKIIMNTQVANAKAVAQFPLTGGMPWVGINTAQGVLAGGAAVAAGAKAIKDLGGSGGAAQSAAASIPASAPPVSTAPTMEGIQSTLLEKTNEKTAQQEVKAYVVESEITAKQERKRAITETANF